jgi:hypothetical protein
VGRKSGRRPGRAEEQRRPSLFFIIALAIGIALLVWGASVVIRRPVSNSKSLGRVVIVAGADAA